MPPIPAWLPRSTFGAMVASIYIVAAVLAVMNDRKSTTGTWISLHGIVTFLVTFPVSWLGEKLGMAPDFRRNTDMTFAIGVCAILVYLGGALMSKVVRTIFSTAPQ